MIEQSSGNSLSFRILQNDNLLGIRTGTINLSGIWKADKNNRLSFLVSKGKNTYDTLTFEGGWEIGKNNEIVYKYSRRELKLSDKSEHLIIFSGSWDFSKGKIIYRLDGSSDSLFSFKSEFVSEKISALNSKIQFIVGISFKRSNVYKTVKHIVTIYGTWKINKDLKLTFSVTYSNRKSREIEFGISRLLGKHDSFSIILTNKLGEPLGLTLEFKKAFRDNAEFFLALSRSGRDSRIMGGLRIKF